MPAMAWGSERSSQLLRPNVTSTSFDCAAPLRSSPPTTLRQSPTVSGYTGASGRVACNRYSLGGKGENKSFLPRTRGWSKPQCRGVRWNLPCESYRARLRVFNGIFRTLALRLSCQKHRSTLHVQLILVQLHVHELHLLVALLSIRMMRAALRWPASQRDQPLQRLQQKRRLGWALNPSSQHAKAFTCAFLIARAWTRVSRIAVGLRKYLLQSSLNGGGEC